MKLGLDQPSEQCSSPLSFLKYHKFGRLYLLSELAQAVMTEIL